MIEYYSAHPLYAVLMVIAIIFALWAFYRAAKLNSKRAAEAREVMNKLKEENTIRNEFSILTPALIDESESEKLFKGVGLNLQKKVSDSKDMNEEFDSFTDEQKIIYSLYTFYEDSRESLSGFFKMNSHPVTDNALAGVKAIFESEFVPIFEAEYNAYDSDNEEASCIPSEIEELDKKAAPFIENGTVCNLCGDYIKSNIEKFI